MKTLRYTCLMLFALVPALASAQELLAVEIGGIQYEAYGAAFTPIPQTPLGPFPIVQTDPWVACSDPDGDTVFEPTINNPEEIEGNIAFITRGSCAFVLKVQAAFEAGAVAVVVANNDQANPDTPIIMGGTYVPGLHDIPAVMVSYNSGQAILGEIEFGAEATIIPIDVTPAPTAGLFNTGVVETAIFDNGFIGDSPGFLGAPGFQFNDDNGLYITAVVIGQDGVVNNSPYGAPEFTPVSVVTAIPSPFPAPFQEFTQGWTTTYDSEELGLRVTLNGYARSGDPFVVFDLNVQNQGGGTAEDVYIGLFSDLDVGDAADNLGGYSANERLVYVYDNTGTSTNYFGMVAISDNVSGWTLATDTDATDESVFAALTTEGDPAATGDLRAVIGVGPFDIGAEPVNARFALVAGADLAAIQANALAAISAGGTATEAVTPEGTYVLEAAYPNPFTAQTRIGFTLPTAQHVRVAVYDVLGRRVAVLVDEARQAGEQAVEFDATGLPSGMYFYRLEAGSTQLMQRVTLIR